MAKNNSQTVDSERSCTIQTYDYTVGGCGMWSMEVRQVKKHAALVGVYATPFATRLQVPKDF